MVIKANTTIAVKDETKEVLDSIRIYPNETYDSIINRLINYQKVGESKDESL